MAITGTFLADFKSFSAAVQNAEVELRGMESGAGKVGASLNRMVDGFSGRTIVQNANIATEAVNRIGGASKLTEAEQAKVNRVVTEAIAKYAALGQTAPAAMIALAEATTRVKPPLDNAGASLETIYAGLKSVAGVVGVAFSAQAVIGFGKAILDSADNLVRLSDQTGISIEGLQTLGYVAAQSGNSLDDVTSAIGKMQLNLNDPKAQQALRNLNINFAELKALQPDEQFGLIADAVSRIPNPVDQSEAAVAIFGKTGISILPTLKAHFKELAGEVTVSSGNQIRALEAAGDALNRAKTNATAWATGLAGNVALVGEKFGWLQTTVAVMAPFLGHLADIDFTNMLESAKRAAVAAAQVGLAVPPVVDVLGAYGRHLDEAADSVDRLSMREQDMIKDAVALGESNTEIAAGMNLTTNAVDVYVKALEREAEAEKRGALVKAKSVEEISKLTEQYNTLRVQHGGTANDIEIARIHQWAANVTAAAHRAGTDTQEFFDARDKLSAEMVRGSGVDWGYIDANSQRALEHMAANAQKTYEEMIFGSNIFSREALEEMRLKTIETADAARGMGKAYEDGLRRAADEATRLKAKLDEAAAAAKKAADEMRAMGGSQEYDLSTTEGMAYFMKMNPMATVAASLDYFLTHTLEQAIRDGMVNLYGRYGNRQDRTPSFADGVDNFGGGMAWVGERGPELVTLPRGSNVTPNGAGGGGTGRVVINNYINGTAEEVARKVGDVIMRNLTLGRQFGTA